MGHRLTSCRRDGAARSSLPFSEQAIAIALSHLRDDLIRASKAFAERVADDSIHMLREVARTSHRPFKDYLVGVHGDTVRFSKDVALSDFTEKICYPILRNAAVAAVFGIAKLAAGSYPYATDRRGPPY